MGAGVAIVILGAGIPIAFALPVLLRRNRHKLYDPSIYSSFGLLYEGLSVERGTSFFESLYMVRKILPVVVFVASLIKRAEFQQVVVSVLLVRHPEPEVQALGHNQHVLNSLASSNKRCPPASFSALAAACAAPLLRAVSGHTVHHRRGRVAVRAAHDNLR